MNIPSFDPERNYLMYVLDILEAIDLITQYVDKTNETVFSRDRLRQDAVIRRFQIIGEATAQIPTKIRSQYPTIPWKKVVAFRNLIIHDYAKINYSKVWTIIHKELPKLKKQLRKVQTDMEKNQKRPVRQ